MTPAQLRAARSYLQITVDDLAKDAEVAPNTISRFERQEGLMRRATMAALVRALYAKGIELREDGSLGPRAAQAA